MSDVPNKKPVSPADYPLFGRLTLRRLLWVLASIWVVFFVIAGAFMIWSTNAEGSPVSKLGTFGDSFGVVNSLLSSASLLAVAWGLAEQSRLRTEQERTTNEQRSHEANLNSQASLTRVYCDIYLKSTEFSLNFLHQYIEAVDKGKPQARLDALLQSQKTYFNFAQSSFEHMVDLMSVAWELAGPIPEMKNPEPRIDS